MRQKPVPAQALEGDRFPLLPSSTVTWTEFDVMLYAVGVGAGVADPTAELNWTTENSAGWALQVLPTFGIVLSSGGSEVFRALDALDESVLLLSESIHLREPIPLVGKVETTRSVVEVKPHRRGSVFRIESVAQLVGAKSVPLFTTSSELLARHDQTSAYDGSKDRSPTKRSDRVMEGPTHEFNFHVPLNQALIYRLTAGRNPLHSDPSASRIAGFDRPILHGRCTLGFAARVLINELVGGDAASVRSLGSRMCSPVWPGDDLVLQVWHSANGGSFRVVRRIDQIAVLDRGVYELAEERDQFSGA